MITTIFVEKRGDFMAWEMRSDRPIYVQLMSEIELRIINGLYPIGTKLPSVRDLATEAGVNPNTMQKALTELERKGLLYTQRTSGRFITDDSAMVQQLRIQLATIQISYLFDQMRQLGFDQKATLELIESTIKEKN